MNTLTSGVSNQNIAFVMLKTFENVSAQYIILKANQIGNKESENNINKASIIMEGCSQLSCSCHSRKNTMALFHHPREADVVHTLLLISGMSLTSILNIKSFTGFRSKIFLRSFL